MVRTMAKAASTAGWQVHIATTDDNGPQTLDVELGRPLPQDGVTYWYFPRQTRFYQCSIPLARWLTRHIREFDVVHIHALFSFSSVVAAYLARRQAVPYIIRPLGTLNDWGMKNRRPWLKRLSFRLVESRILKNAALVHYTSDQERIEAAQLGKAHSPIVIPNAVPEPEGGAAASDFLDIHPQLANRKVALFLSRLDPKKGLDLLLQAVKQVQAECPEFLLLVAGDGEPTFVEGLKHQARDLGIEDHICWAGFLSGPQKRAAFAAADLFVLPSYSENFGIAVVEAMFQSIPVVISDQVAIHREVSRADAGVVTHCDATELGCEIVGLLRNSERRSRIAQNGLELAQSSFSVTSLSASLAEAYSTVTLNGRREVSNAV